MELPKITIVTPSYNQGRYLKQTIRSILGQTYPNLEYIVMDGGSKDNSAEIIERYADRLAYWTSGPDDGQTDAIAKGFARATGDILGWVNSDDFLLPRALEAVCKAFQANSDCVWVAGRCVFVDSGSVPLSVQVPRRQSLSGLLFWGAEFAQPATFWSRQAYEEVGGLDTSLRFAFDFDLFLRFRQRAKINVISEYLSAFRFHEASKTMSWPLKVKKDEIHRIIKRYRNVSSAYLELRERLAGRDPLRKIQNARVWRKDKSLMESLCKGL
ncbi:MAG: glycosyltransferase [Planctomycetota bacterium]|nr:MAG: glycosyltransferase [Planctomycetota bacterium]